MKRVTVVMEEWLHKKAKIRAAETDLSVNDLMIEAVKMYLQESSKYIKNGYID
tara:strand:- start:1436 stop:1594 length:159 start_codon:yes stop_codon:yes gene_type:complete